ncbi:Pentatricopeptide repeat [Macleaya cordata]|uniref:Pentatricopeptide repeat n=1 Tax=Macleaya cordata TaxID=56857 RepID=A0A200QWY0_MACCD|nr:Pentatricopeptide repeat [Macleaya cordata]
MGSKGICAFSPSDHAVQLDLIGRVRGHDSAESYFNDMSDQDKTDKTYGALLNCYVRERVADKSLSHMQKMKELGFASSPLSYNDLMCLYTNISEYEKIPTVLIEMKDNGVSPDNFSYRICINSYGARSDIDGMEKVLQEMEDQPHIVMDWNTYAVVANFYIKASLTDKALDALKKSEEIIDKEDALCYNHLISLYASLGNKTEVMRLWELEKASCKRVINRDYITMMSALVKLEEFEEADKLLEEWESSGNNYDLRVPNTLLLGYSQKGLGEKAEKMLENRVEKGKVPTKNCWGIVAGGYLQKDNMENAVRCMKTSLSLHDGNDGWRPNPKVLSKILRWIGDNGKIEEVEAFVGLLKTVIPTNREMYHALIKANIREGKEVDGLLESMKTDKIDEDKETEKILSSRQEKAV